MMVRIIQFTRALGSAAWTDVSHCEVDNDQDGGGGKAEEVAGKAEEDGGRQKRTLLEPSVVLLGLMPHDEVDDNDDENEDGQTHCHRDRDSVLGRDAHVKRTLRTYNETSHQYSLTIAVLHN
jgi:hypothetical protein